MLSRKLGVIFPRVLCVGGAFIRIVQAQVHESLAYDPKEGRGEGRAADQRVRSAHAQAVALEPRPARHVRAVADAGVDAETAC